MKIEEIFRMHESRSPAKLELKQRKDQRKFTPSAAIAFEAAQNRLFATTSSPPLDLTGSGEWIASNTENDEVMCAIKFLLKNSQSGSLIGTGGRAIRELMDVSGSKIHISGASDHYPGTLDRVVYITGTEDAVTTAQSLIWEMIAQQQGEDGTGSNEDWNPRIASEKPGQYDYRNVTGKIAIPCDAAGSIFGRGGANLRSISEESGTVVTVSPKEEAEITRERVITITGITEGCINCTSLILAKLCEDPETAAYETPGTKYPNHAYSPSSGINSSHYNNSNNNNITNNNNGYYNYSNSNTGSSGNKDYHSHSPISHSGSHRVIEKDSGRRQSRQSNTSSANSPHQQHHQHQHQQRGSPPGATTLSVLTTLTVSVPDNLVGSLVGKQGSTLREIMSSSAVNITISHRGDFVEGTQNRIVTIVGNPKNVQLAKKLIDKKLMS